MYEAQYDESAPVELATVCISSPSSPVPMLPALPESTPSELGVITNLNVALRQRCCKRYTCYVIIVFGVLSCIWPISILIGIGLHVPELAQFGFISFIVCAIVFFLFGICWRENCSIPVSWGCSWMERHQAYYEAH